MKIIRIIGALIIGLALILWIGYTTQLYCELQVIRSKLPSQTEIQQQLVDLGYPITVDGVVGDKTRKVWDEAICNQYASEYDYYYEVRK